jgi:4-hydroxybenzoate polyprenyltransferase
VSLALLGWISGGAARPHLLAAMVPYLACLAFAGTITAAFRDLDLDAVVGNHTLPVVLGGPAALRLAAGLEATGLLVVVVTAIALDEAAGLWYCALAGAVLAAAYRPYSRRLGEPDRGRRARIADGFPWAIGGLLKSVAMIVVLTGVPHVGWVAVGAASFVAIWRTLRRLYDARIVKGGLAVRLGIPHPAH